MAQAALARPAVGGAALGPALKDAVVTTLVTLVLLVPLLGMQIGTGPQGTTLNFHMGEVAVAAAIVFVVRLLLTSVPHARGWVADRRTQGALLPSALFVVGVVAAVLIFWAVQSAYASVVAAVVLVYAVLVCFPSMPFGGSVRVSGAVARHGSLAAAALGLMVAVTLPFLPFSSRYIVDIGTTVLIYVMLGWGLNIVVGLAGLLDLGYVAFYAIGAYSYALLSTHFGWSFWVCLPLAGVLAATFGVLLGFPVLRLRGDYLAIVTLGFGEIVRIVLLNWTPVTGGPNGIGGIPRPSFFGYDFVRNPPEGKTSFAQLFGIDYSPEHRVIFLYYLILALALFTNLVVLRLRRLPIGRAWEALREDEIACKALGINPTNTKLTAFALGAMFGGFAGSFFSTRQGFISPESFTFIESAIILAIVVLGGMGSQVGVVLAATVLVVMPEAARQFAQYRMLLFGAAMVGIMVWRPGGLMSGREPTIRLHRRRAAAGSG
ncbi:MAG TPA: high-affinity branched-chain amino acid ABC transporter permease LivM [Gaiellales bacterium]|nr:high-affinity branched-chain amino acid ABC transporter permease LivM [Gaiellales bacterium]